MKTKNTSESAWLLWLAGAGCLVALGASTGGCELIASVDPDLLNEGGGGSGTTSTVTGSTSSGGTTNSSSQSSGSAGGGDGGQGGTGGGEGGQGGTGGNGGQGGGTGGGDVCDDPGDCPDPGECRAPTCEEDGTCGETLDNEGDPCEISAGVDGVCTAGGDCAECLTELQCPVPAECQVAVCNGGACGTVDADDGDPCDGGTCLGGVCDVDPLCENRTLDAPNETDVDCGGTCPNCANNLNCNVGTDCQSGFCDPVDTTCRDCGDDGDCPGNQFCGDDGVCTDDKDDGATCDDGAECTSTFCADGFCCESACNGTCESCNATGSCDPVPDGNDDDDECADGVECQTGACNGARACGNDDATTECGVGPSCDASGALDQGLCNGSGACVEDTTPTSCGVYDCDGDICGTSCAGNGDCATDAFCNDSNLCQAEQANGATCGGDDECTSGNCVDGVCCNTACDGLCEACSAAGACTPIPAGTDPDIECAPSACGTGFCGTGNTCEAVADGTPGSPVCTGDILCDGTSTTCPANCVTDADCDATRFCDDAAIGNSGDCLPGDADPGDPCVRGSQCTSNSCGVGMAGECD